MNDPSRTGAGKASLARAISGPQFFAVAFGCIVGVAWIVVLGDLVAQAGPVGTALALGVAACAILLIAFCYAEMAARRPGAGGELVFAYGLAGPPAAYAAGWTLGLVYTAACAFEAISMGQLTALLFPTVEGPVLYSLLGQDVRLGSVLIGGGLVIAIWVLNAVGARESARVQAWITYARLALMAGFLAVALIYADPVNLQPLIAGENGPAKLAAFLSVLATAPFWFGGFNVVVTASEESATSMAVMGRALVWAVIAAAVFYIMLVLAVGALVPQATLVSLELPAAQAFEVALQNPFMTKLVLVTALLGNLTAWNSLVLAGSRIFFALGRARLCPESLGQVNRHRAPGRAVALISLASLVALPLGRGFILPLVNITSAAFGLIYLVTCLALLRERRVSPVSREYAVPGGLPTIYAATIAAFLISAVALIQPWFASRGAIPPEWITLALWSALALGIWVVGRRAFHAISEEERGALMQGAAR
jgi:amino acid transporter